MLIVNSDFQGHCRDSVGNRQVARSRRAASPCRACPIHARRIDLQRELVHVTFANHHTGASAPADALLTPGRRAHCNKLRYRDASPCDSRRARRGIARLALRNTRVWLRIVRCRSANVLHVRLEREPALPAPGQLKLLLGSGIEHSEI